MIILVSLNSCCGCYFTSHQIKKMPYAEEASEKKKKKFWDIFRRRRKGSDTSSEEEDDAKKRGFLGRKKKDRGSKDVTNSFLINPPIIPPIIRTDLKNSAESIRSNSSELSGRRRIKAKVEASRELLAQESSSDEGSSYTSYTSSLQSAGSFPRRSRAARTERHNRRISRDLDGKMNKWTANIVYQESKDYDTKYRAKAKSATPSPAQSPKAQRATLKVKYNFRSTSTDSIHGKRTPPTPPPRREPRPQSLADPPRYYPPVYTAPSHMIQARLRQSSQKSLSEQYLARLRMETSRSVSPRPTPTRTPTRTESTSSISSESFGKKEDIRPLSVVAEKSEVSDLDCRRPPHIPRDRTTPRQISLPTTAKDIQEARKHSSNLEEALNELEAIYKKLSYDEKSYDSSCNGEVLPTDDMAYRRLNKREPSCQDVREIMSQAGSYLLVSPTLSPPPIICHPPPESPSGEPDITYDDVVFRSVNHSNNMLKVLDPQPPFGIPLGPISPASNSDYLHVRPRFIQSGSTPDLVMDDLAFRNLRKDHSKKKAVRSLSANLSGVINRNYINNNNLNVINNNLEERSHSYSDIPNEEMRLAQRVFDMRKKRKSPSKEEARQRFFTTERDTEYALLEQLAVETRAASDQIDRELRQLSGADYTRSMTDILQEMTQNLNYDFGCQTCTKESYRDSRYLQPLRYNRPATRPGSIAPRRPRNPFKEDPWVRRRESKQDRHSPLNGESYDDDVFLDNCDSLNGYRRDERARENACRNIRDAASGLCRLDKEQGSAMLAVAYCMACSEQTPPLDIIQLLAIILAVACLFLFLLF